jgi:hypothetical protein
MLRRKRMKIFNYRWLILALSLILMTGCAEQKASTDTKTETNAKTGTNTEPVTVSQENRAPKAPPSNKLDACEVLPKTEVEKIIGDGIKSANLSRVTEGTQATAAFSQCTYTANGGQIVEFFARRSPINDNTTEAIQKSRDTMKGFGKLEDVSGIGKTAFWIGSSMNQLHVFEGENIYLYFTMRGSKTEAEAKAKATELAKQAINYYSKK